MAEFSRRNFLKMAVGTVAATAILPACKKGSEQKELSCTDTSGLSAPDLQMRNTLQYVDKSVQPGKQCANCIQFQPSATPDTCGSCKLVKGPINPAGYCTAWAAKPA